MSSVLQLRGEQVCDQPLLDKNGSALQWNGQIFGGIEIDDCDSDTQVLMKLLSKCTKDEELLKVMSSISGPWSFTYWDNKTKQFWFGRDILGRRSLCWNINRRDELLTISSICHFSHFDDNENLIWTEIPANGIYCLDLSKNCSLQETINNLKHFDWNQRISGEKLTSGSSITLYSPITVPLNRSLPNEENLCEQIPRIVIEQFIHVLRESVKKRCLNQQSLCKKCFIRSVNNNEDNIENQSSSDSEGDIVGPTVIPSKILEKECTHASTAILFSGGLDSTIIALLADECVSNSFPIDLLNVAFDSDAPDRETGLNAWNELKTLRPNRRWNFVSIYISKEELQAMREKHIKHLVKPSQTVLDDSIGCAIWFAANGKGLLLEEHEVTSVYETPARVVLLGMGADEQLAGYSRHRRIFDRNGWNGLIDELALEIDRLSSRNLGRDDRVTSDHGREPRYPFLDEEVINFLNGIPVWHKCNLTLDRSAGEKLLLRKVAARLGLCQTSQHLKRAIQFGSRIAKIEVNREKGEHICSRLAS
jgi:asparagine synthetase B (glutamine-hydrolysing)